MKISLPTRSLAYVLGIFLLTGGAVSVASTSDQQATAAELVRRLGSDLFQEREEATQALEKLGLEAREALAEGLNSSDAEIVRRCRTLLPLIETQEMEILIKKISAPGADPEGLKLPGWDRFKDKVGSDATAKKFYLDLCRSELSLIRDVERKPELGYDLIQNRCISFSQSNPPAFPRGNNGQNPQISETELGAILFCALNPKVKLPANNQFVVNSLFHYPSVRSMVQKSEAGTPLRRLIGLWLALPDDARGMINNIYLAKGLNLSEGTDLAVRVLQETLSKKLTPSAYEKATAMTSLNKLGNKSHVKLLIPFFSDDAIITVNAVGGGVNQDRISTQLNDVALAIAVHLTGQDHKSYGFHSALIAPPGRPMSLDSPYGMGFTSQQKRDEAFAKWTKWVKETKFDPNAAVAKPDASVSKPASPTANTPQVVTPKP